MCCVLTVLIWYTFDDTQRDGPLQNRWSNVQQVSGHSVRQTTKSWFIVGFRVVHNEMYCTSNKTGNVRIKVTLRGVRVTIVKYEGYSKINLRPRFVLLLEQNESQHVPHSWRERRWQSPCSISIYSYTTRRKCMRVRVQQEQKFLVTTELALWRHDNAFIFTNQSEVDFGMTLVCSVQILKSTDPFL